ncbi:hypothetical protein G5X03_004743 [Salmonella enterica]|nr:hypothetical protein [Salmonella enterica]
MDEPTKVEYISLTEHSTLKKYSDLIWQTLLFLIINLGGDYPLTAELKE